MLGNIDSNKPDKGPWPFDNRGKYTVPADCAENDGCPQKNANTCQTAPASAVGKRSGKKPCKLM